MADFFLKKVIERYFVVDVIFNILTAISVRFTRTVFGDYYFVFFEISSRTFRGFCGCLRKKKEKDLPRFRFEIYNKKY